MDESIAKSFRRVSSDQHYCQCSTGSTNTTLLFMNFYLRWISIAMGIAPEGRSVVSIWYINSTQDTPKPSKHVDSSLVSHWRRHWGNLYQLPFHGDTLGFTHATPLYPSRCQVNGHIMITGTKKWPYPIWFCVLMVLWPFVCWQVFCDNAAATNKEACSFKQA